MGEPVSIRTKVTEAIAGAWNFAFGAARPDDSRKGSDYEESIWDRTVVATAREYKPIDVETFWRNAEKGDLLKLMAFFDEMRARDPHLDAELKKAELMILAGDMGIEAWPPKYRDVRDVSPEANRSRAIADYCREQFFNPQVRHLEALRHLITGLWKQVAGWETVATPGAAEGRERIDAFVLIPAQRFWYPKGDTRLHFQPTYDRGWTIPVEDLQDKLCVLTVDDEVPNPARRGLLRRLMASYLIRSVAARWWNHRVEVDGQATRVATVPAGYAEREAVDAWMKNLGNAPHAVLEAPATVQLLESAKPSTMHRELMDFHAREMSKEIQGGSQLSDIEKGTGSHSNASTQEAFAWMIAEGRFRYVAGVVRAGFLRHLVERNFSPDDADKYTPELTGAFEDERELLTFSQAVVNLNSAGMDLSMRWLYKGIGDTPDDKEPMLPGKKPGPNPLDPTADPNADPNAPDPKTGKKPPADAKKKPMPPMPGKAKAKAAMYETIRRLLADGAIRFTPAIGDAHGIQEALGPDARTPDFALALGIAAQDEHSEKDVRTFERLAARLNFRIAVQGIAVSQKRAMDHASKIAVKSKAGTELVAPFRDVLRRAEKDGLTIEQTWRAIKHRHSQGVKSPKLVSALTAVALTTMKDGLAARTKKFASHVVAAFTIDVLNIDFLSADVKAYWADQFAANPDELTKLVDLEQAKAQQLSGVWEKRFIEDLYASAQDAVQNGTTVSDWIKTADEILSRYTPDGVDVLVDPSGERGDQFSSWYGDLVFRMAASNAYSAGRYAQMFSPDGQNVAEFWIYSSLHDDRVREEHEALDAAVFRKDDPSARQFLPPWDFSCRCLASDLDQEQVDAGGYEVSRGADFGFDAPKGFSADRVRQLVPAPVRELMAEE